MTCWDLEPAGDKTQMEVEIPYQIFQVVGDEKPKEIPWLGWRLQSQAKPIVTRADWNISKVLSPPPLSLSLSLSLLPSLFLSVPPFLLELNKNISDTKRK